MDFQQKRMVKIIMYSKLTLFILFILVIAFSRAVWNIYQKERFSRENLTSVENEYRELSSRKEYLEGQIQKLNTSEGIEGEIRNKFSVGKEGEISVLVVDSSSSDEKTSETKNDSLWQRFLGFFTR